MRISVEGTSIGEDDSRRAARAMMTSAEEALSQ